MSKSVPTNKSLYDKIKAEAKRKFKVTIIFQLRRMSFETQDIFLKNI